MITIYSLGENNDLSFIKYLSEDTIGTWLACEGMDYLTLRLVKESGNFTDIMLTESTEWDVVNRGIDTLLIEGKKSFKDFSNKAKKDNAKRNDAKKDKPLDQKSHMMKAARGLDRKKQSYVPMYKQIAHLDALPTADNVLKGAKKASSGAWKLSKRQVMEIASKYKFNIPTARKRTKHLGSTGILMWRKSAKDYYLVKFSKHHSKTRK